MVNVGSEKTVVVIDDDVATFKGISRIARQAGFNTEAFPDCLDFSRWLDAHAADASVASRSYCLVIDVKSLLPDAEWHSNPHIRSIPKLCVGTPVAISTMGQVMNGFECEFIRKPFTLDAIQMHIEDALARYASNASETFDNKRIIEMFALLTKREHEVAALVGSGSSNLDIAAVLGITLKTVKAHRAKVMEKTAASTIADFVRKYERYRQAVLKTEGASLMRSGKHKVVS
ncbi:MAG: LuxR C-terminal-related transcriptional regulator [Gammaproteobacteria bacterium]|nr:LuxR C-terminal-related transcriptional regulator [Gammaproteobacteria bacterium]MBU1625700.1 LuxR C-terminal-related transcriptional regulator [Gammaproteobacteria bacterium]MBU1980960.1 LuxR C-terminal-related transcriptional regulator [Gammaproteobacteria bacterium]